MKIYLITLLLLLTACTVWCQKAEIQSLEAGLSSQTGEKFAEDAAALARLYLEEGMYEMASKRANAAYDAARKGNYKKVLFQVLQTRGELNVATAKGKRIALNRAYKSFAESNLYAEAEEKKLPNLYAMKSIAEQLNRVRDVQKLDYEIAKIKGEELPDLPTEESLSIFNKKKKKSLEAYQKQKAERENLVNEKEDLAEELSELSEEQASLRQQQESLIALLEVKETAILDMSEQQMKKELLFSEQERLLDSLTFVSILDSLELSQKEMLVERQDAELKKQESALELKNSQQNFLLAIAALIVIAAGGLLHRYFVMRSHNTILEEKNKIIIEERERSEELLLNILPKTIADELKNRGVAETRHFENATVMFVDFVGFSKISKQLTPQQLVGDLDHAFKNFDAIIEEFKLEKIKTIGDAYMCAGGLPSEDASHPVNVVKAAIEMQNFLDQWNEEKQRKGEPVFEARIGIHTGPLVAGVVGSKKFAYDIWGDTVNVASRMETSCEAGKVNISNSTYKKIKHVFDCEYRGIVPAKNVGAVEMYYVNDN